MSPLGPLNYSAEEGYQKPFSEETGAMIDVEIKKIIDSAL
jgi:ATP-dependent Zn protease